MKYVIKNRHQEPCFRMDWELDAPIDWAEKAAWVLAAQHNFDSPYSEIWRYFRRLEDEVRESDLYRAKVTLR